MRLVSRWFRPAPGSAAAFEAVHAPCSLGDYRDPGPSDGGFRMSPQILKLSALSGLAAALGGCATYGPPSRNIAYFAVPCNTPGAFVAQPLSAPDAPPATPGPGGPGGPAAQNVQACMIAVPAQNLAYNARYRGGRGLLRSLLWLSRLWVALLWFDWDRLRTSRRWLWTRWQLWPSRRLRSWWGRRSWRPLTRRSVRACSYGKRSRSDTIRLCLDDDCRAYSGQESSYATPGV